MPELESENSPSGANNDSRSAAGVAPHGATPPRVQRRVKFTGGPKAELDRNFGRKKILGALRFDFNFQRWDASIGGRRKMIKCGAGRRRERSRRRPAFKETCAAGGPAQNPSLNFKVREN
jgi:hypothetical protein